MKRHQSHRFRLLITLLALITTSVALAQTSSYVNFEGAQTSPVRLSADGTHLFAVNTPDARLSVFDVSSPLSPKLTAEIPVGIEPVSVNPRTADEVWVVNQVSDSVSVVSISKGRVTDTLHTGDEPSDVVFSGNHAFVSIAGEMKVEVFDVRTHALVKSLALLGHGPRSMAVSADGSKVYVVFALSGNKTTVLPQNVSPPQPPPTNPALPPAPSVAMIVSATDPNYKKYIKYTMPDNDVAQIDTSTFAIKYFSGVGTINLGIAVRPGSSGDLYVSNTDALNLTHFEPNVRGHFENNRVTRIGKLGTNTSYDLNPGVDYTILPNPAALTNALAQPAGLAFDSAGTHLYVASFGTDRIGVINPDNGSIISRIEVGSTPGTAVNPATKRGPRGLALNSNTSTLYVLNRISNTISLINTIQNSVVSEIPTGSYDPTPAVIRNGRGFLYDAKLSGNGTVSCASCHVDAEMDHLGWDLGDPGGNMVTVVSGGLSYQLHPMKGTMTTQTLRGLNNLAPYHWRGDRADFSAFNPAFGSLMGGNQLSTSDMAAYTNFINTIAFQPNPNQNLDRTLPATFHNGDPNAGLNTYMNEFYQPTLSCGGCHTANPGPGSDLLVKARTGPGATTQPMKVPQLRNVYQKLLLNAVPGAQSIDGFGLRNDGATASLAEFFSAAIFGTFSDDPVRKANLTAYVMCFDTGTAPAVGYSDTLTSSNVGSSSIGTEWTTLEGQAAATNIDLIAKGTIQGQLHGLLYQPASQNYKTDKTGLGPFTRAQLVTFIQAKDTLTLMGVPPGSGVRMGIDRNQDGILDGDH